MTKDTQAAVSVAVGKIAKLSAGELSINTQRTTQDLLGRLPQADRVYLEQMMMSVFCSALNSDKSKTDSEKAFEIRRYVTEMRKSLPPIGPFITSTPASSNLGPPKTIDSRSNSNNEPRKKPVATAGKVSANDAKALRAREADLVLESAPPRVALLIANWNYEQRQFVLKNPANDVDQVARVLRTFGFRTVIRENLNRQDTEKTFSDFRNILGMGGVGVVYYSGHGFGTESDSYIVPVDIGAVKNIDEARTQSFNVTEYLLPLDTSLGLTPYSSGDVAVFAAEKVAYDAAESNDKISPFARAVTESLGLPSKRLSDVILQVFQRTHNYTEKRQTPFLVSTQRKEFDFGDRRSDKELGVLKILFFDACRNDPFKVVATR